VKLPYLTSDLPGIGGQTKQRLEDFQVEELPLYEACGEGTHVYFRVVKSGIPTPAAVDRIARHMHVRPTEIGLAGLKDARAVTAQRMSLEHCDPARLLAYRDPQVCITGVWRHTNKLRPGHLAGNRFTVRIRGVGEADLPRAQEVLDVLVRRGVANYFGPQRFGARGDTGRLGKALILGDLDEFVALYLGRSAPDDPPDCRQARDAFDTGFYARAMDCWPRHYANQRKALAAYRKKRRPAQALSAIDKRMKRLFVSACQSEIFNDVLTQRLDTLDRVLAGDLAKKADTGGVFPVTDADAEGPRAERFEISATGPIPGSRCDLAGGEPGRIEREAIAAAGLTEDDFNRVGSLKVKGTRRPLRFRLDQPALVAGADENGDYIELQFAAPSGCYATVALREITKDEAGAE